jgi:hypothetical protein
MSMHVATSQCLMVVQYSVKLNNSSMNGINNGIAKSTRSLLCFSMFKVIFNQIDDHF